MRAVVNRFGPLAVALSGVALTTLMIQIDDRRRSALPDDGMLRFPAFEATAWWVLGTSCAIGMGWLALPAGQRSPRTMAALAYVVIWVAIGSAIAFDIGYDVLGPGVEPVRDTCKTDNMDCIGQPSTSPPLLGGDVRILVGCYMILSTPLALLVLIASAFRAGGAGEGRAAGVHLL